jgi:hypothetical protein
MSSRRQYQRNKNTSLLVSFAYEWQLLGSFVLSVTEQGPYTSEQFSQKSQPNNIKT